MRPERRDRAMFGALEEPRWSGGFRFEENPKRHGVFLITFELHCRCFVVDDGRHG